MVQQEQHILRESPAVFKSLTFPPLACVYYTSQFITELAEDLVSTMKRTDISCFNQGQEPIAGAVHVGALILCQV